jgi:hypothetical protein
VSTDLYLEPEDSDIVEALTRRLLGLKSHIDKLKTERDEAGNDNEAGLKTACEELQLLKNKHEALVREHERVLSNAKNDREHGVAVQQERDDTKYELADAKDKMNVWRAFAVAGWLATLGTAVILVIKSI